MKPKIACMPKKRCWSFSCAVNNARIYLFGQSKAEIQVKKILGSFFILMLTFGSAEATTVYVTDSLNVAFRNEENTQSKAIKLLPSGTPLTVLSQNKETGFLHARLDNGMEGYILARHTMKEPPSRFQLDTANKKLALLEKENTAIKAELNSLKASLTPGTSLEQSLATERDHLAMELNELKQTASHVVEIKNQRDELQERVVNIERELEQLKLENKALADSSKQDWFLYGGILSLIGVIMGFILPKLGWRRRSSSWDTF
jgi:SH3 domain protein